LIKSAGHRTARFTEQGYLNEQKCCAQLFAWQYTGKTKLGFAITLQLTAVITEA